MATFIILTFPFHSDFIAGADGVEENGRKVVGADDAAAAANVVGDEKTRDSETSSYSGSEQEAAEDSLDPIER